MGMEIKGHACTPSHAEYLSHAEWVLSRSDAACELGLLGSLVDSHDVEGRIRQCRRPSVTGYKRLCFSVALAQTEAKRQLTSTGMICRSKLFLLRSTQLHTT
jgi:hypothetical protein